MLRLTGMFGGKLIEAVLLLAHEVRALREERRHEFDWFRLHVEFATKTDLKQMEDRMAIKLSELKGEVAGLRSQVTKIWGEQQSKYDALVVEFNTLKASLDNVELPADVATDLAEFKAQLQGFDDSIPDTTA